MAVMAARVARSAAKKFISIAHANSSSLVPRKPSRRSRTAPTLFTRTSTRPCASIARWTSGAGPAGASRSTATGVTRSRPVEGVDGARPGDDEGALVGQRARDRQADALARAGDDRHRAGQLQIHPRAPVAGPDAASLRPPWGALPGRPTAVRLR